mmetsp:Transcript_15704/g.13392  ORF Transcript_15704/g.13392 Transcript_15704/m.13392 type:complete len:99 (+) Transcript_15704:432-728(+)
MRSLWNGVDFAFLTLAIITPILIITENLEDFIDRAWMVSATIFLGYLRWVAYLRIFRQTRTLIRIITEIVRDMIGFMIVLVFIIFGFSIIFRQFETDN